LEQAVTVKKLIKKRHVYNMMLVVVLAVSAVYGYLFYNQTDVTALTASVDPDGPPVFNRMIYGGFGNESFKKPMDVVVTSQFIYVTDTNNKRVQVFDLGGSPLFKFGKEGDKPGEFKFPYGITSDSKGNIYVADLYNGCISIHDSKGKFIKYFAEQKPGDKTIENPGGLRIINNKLYVTDIQNSKVKVFDLNGKLLLEIGKPGRNPGELLAPNAVLADKEGDIFVTDTGNQRVQMFDKTGKFIRIINGSADGMGQSAFVNPRGIAFDSKDRLYVVSNFTHYIYIFDKDGKQLFTIGGFGEAVDQFALPNGLFITANDEMFVTDTMNQRVAVYE